MIKKHKNEMSLKPHLSSGVLLERDYVEAHLGSHKVIALIP